MSSATETAVVRYMDAIRAGIADELRDDERVVLIGIDVGAGGGIFGVTRGLYEEFGPERVRDTPISELAFVGAAVGAAATGLRPVVELLRYMTGGLLRFPLVVRTQTGAGNSSGAQHSQSLEAMIAHVPGLKVVLPSSVEDAYALMRAAVRDDDPVVYVENRRLYRKKGPISASRPALPLGVAAVRRPGSDVTVVAWSRMVDVALEAADALATSDGIELEVIDLRSLVPMDLETVLASVARTGRAVVVHEAVLDFGAGAEVAARVMERGWGDLRAPVARVGAPPVPMPFSPPLENYCIPDADDVVAAVRRLVAER
jgi:pyruvate/2-oxoglutarate/acetoin dehydrogenase E1 component